MTPNKTALAAFLMAAGALALHSTGCEIITEVDRSLIDAGADAACSATQTSCKSPADCPAQTTACVTNACDGCCSTNKAAAGTACSDNGGKLCDGNGKCAGCLAPTDCPAQTTVCKINACDGTAHTCSTTNAAAGTACSDSGGVNCDGKGSCVPPHCSDGVKDSDETDVDCGGSCGATCKDTGPQQACKVPGDCLSGVCTGLLCQPPTCSDGIKNGNETDVDCGGTQCVNVAKWCSAGKKCLVVGDCISLAPCNGDTYGPPSICNGSNVCQLGTPVDCTATGKVCDVNGSGCVACNTANDCPPTGNECIARTCNGSVCGTSNLGQSHVMSTGQTSGNCQVVVCNGSGGTVSIDDNTDPPPASGTVCATAPHCAGSPLAPAYTFASIGTSCTADGQWPKQVCGDPSNVAVAGKCVQCNVNGECTAINDAGTLACISNVCQ